MRTRYARKTRHELELWELPGAVVPLNLFASTTQVCDALEDSMVQGGCIVDYHGCDFFPERYAAGGG